MTMSAVVFRNNSLNDVGNISWWNLCISLANLIYKYRDVSDYGNIYKDVQCDI